MGRDNYCNVDNGHGQEHVRRFADRLYDVCSEEFSYSYDSGVLCERPRHVFNHGQCAKLINHNFSLQQYRSNHPILQRNCFRPDISHFHNLDVLPHKLQLHDRTVENPSKNLPSRLHVPSGPGLRLFPKLRTNGLAIKGQKNQQILQHSNHVNFQKGRIIFPYRKLIVSDNLNSKWRSVPDSGPDHIFWHHLVRVVALWYENLENSVYFRDNGWYIGYSCFSHAIGHELGNYWNGLVFGFVWAGYRIGHFGILFRHLQYHSRGFIWNWLVDHNLGQKAA